MRTFASNLHAEKQSRHKRTLAAGVRLQKWTNYMGEPENIPVWLQDGERAVSGTQDVADTFSKKA